ncbi:MAG: AAA family ATPase, partial [Porphyromonadaceae bacterium]|nr:AAA family ATPase [Porphyromonadaceae bacterium]
MNKPLVKYPVGVQSFEKLREYSYLYIDKTDLIYDLVTSDNCIFLARPRRFGKSLLLSTIQAYFEGKKELFKGLAIEQLETDWIEHPVLMLSLAAYRPVNGNLEGLLSFQFDEWEKKYNIQSNETELSLRFRQIIKSAYEATGTTVVILIDEYDNPIISTMHDMERSEDNRQLLKSIYVNIKDLDQYIRFTMLTGVSRFSKMTIFSGLNNLRDISFNRKYATICGITETELTANFQQGIKELAEEYGTDADGAVALLKANYNGYHFTADCPDLYNPFSLLWAFADSKIGSYWFQSGTPEFLVRRIQESGDFLPEMFDETVEERTLSASDISKTSPTALMYQTGYLTIKHAEGHDLFRLGIPNLEVRRGLFENLAEYFFDKDDIKVTNNVRRVRNLLEEKKIDEAMER